jgi:hypothetical protein
MLENRKKHMRKGYDALIKECKEIYDNKYEYSEENRETFSTRRDKIKIICPIHGEFIKSGQKHVWGQGCPECTIDRLIQTGVLSGGYNEEWFNNHPDMQNKKAFLYYLSIDGGRLFKVGISINPTKRLNGIRCSSKRGGYSGMVEEILVIETTLKNAYTAEQEFLREFSDVRCFRRWSTELFTKNIMEEERFHEILKKYKLE